MVVGLAVGPPVIVGPWFWLVGLMVTSTKPVSSPPLSSVTTTVTRPVLVVETDSGTKVTEEPLPLIVPLVADQE